MQGADTLLPQIDDLLSGHIGPPYPAAELRALVDEANSFRFPNKIPPGYLDTDKETPLRAAGDFLLWRQTIDKAALLQGHDRLVLLVTKETKGDWWVLDEKKWPGGTTGIGSGTARLHRSRTASSISERVHGRRKGTSFTPGSRPDPA